MCDIFSTLRQFFPSLSSTNPTWASPGGSGLSIYYEMPETNRLSHETAETWQRNSRFRLTFLTHSSSLFMVDSYWFYEIWDCNCGVDEDSGLLGCGAVSFVILDVSKGPSAFMSKVQRSESRDAWRNLFFICDVKYWDYKTQVIYFARQTSRLMHSYSRFVFFVSGSPIHRLHGHVVSP